MMPKLLNQPGLMIMLLRLAIDRILIRKTPHKPINGNKQQ
jgi:hypothetical protein